MLRITIPGLNLLLLLCATAGFSQRAITGQLLSATDQSPIPFANIGILNTPVGTLSNPDGTFQLLIPPKYQHDSLLFAALGYERKMISLQSLFDPANTTISLVEKVVTLKQVVISAEKKKQKAYSIGNRYTNGGFLYADSVSAGAAMTLLIENKFPSYYPALTSPFFLKEVKFYINKNSVDNFRIRVRFLERDSVSGLPGKDLFPENIIVTSSIRKGWLDVDLTDYHFVIHRPFYLALEWIMDDNARLALLGQYATFRKANPDRVKADSTIVDGKKVGFWSYLGFKPGTHLGVSALPFSLENYTCFYRTNSFGEWNRAPVILTVRASVIPLGDKAKQ